MKKQLLIISVLVVIVSILVSCSVSSGKDDLIDEAISISTTAITDSNGANHYYEIVTDVNGNTDLAEIETYSNGNVVTEKNGKYVTKEHTSLSDESTANNNSANADNVVEFDPTDITSQGTATTNGASPIPAEKETVTTIAENTTQKEIQPATDKDGWINKWY